MSGEGRTSSTPSPALKILPTHSLNQHTLSPSCTTRLSLAKPPTHSTTFLRERELTRNGREFHSSHELSLSHTREVTDSRGLSLARTAGNSLDPETLSHSLAQNPLIHEITGGPQGVVFFFFFSSSFSFSFSCFLVFCVGFLLLRLCVRVCVLVWCFRFSALVIFFSAISIFV